MKTQAIAIVILILIIAGTAGVYFYTTFVLPQKPIQSPSPSPSPSTATSASTPTPTPNQPSIVVDAIHLQVFPAAKQNGYSLGTTIDTPSSASDTLLVVKALWSGINYTDELSEKMLGWGVTVTDESGRVSQQDTLIVGVNGDVTWLFDVTKTLQLFTLNFPGNQTIKLTLS